MVKMNQKTIDNPFLKKWWQEEASIESVIGPWIKGARIQNQIFIFIW